MLNITEIFQSVQGETSLAGIPTLFIRLAACNLRCSWCDTPYSFGRGEPHTLEALIAAAKEAALPAICVTGGEPLLQKNVHPLMSTLSDLGYLVSLETGGSLTTEHVDPRVRTILDIKCPKSGMEGKNFWQNLTWLKGHDEVKFVVQDRADFDYAIGVCRNYALFERAMLPLFSPVHGALDPKVLVGWILEEKIPARLNLQQHKYIWTPTTRGV